MIVAVIRWTKLQPTYVLLRDDSSCQQIIHDPYFHNL